MNICIDGQKYYLLIKGGVGFKIQLLYLWKGVSKIKIKKSGIRIKLWCQKGQSTLEYALVTVIAGIISAILIAVGKPLIIDVISKVFGKIASMV